MQEGRAILAAAAALPPGAGALATVVGLVGSGYRRPGARMLVGPTGQTIGGISGGCLESDAADHALAVMAHGSPRLLTYDTTDPDDVLLGVGLGCQGVVSVLVEPVATDACQAFLAAWRQALAGRATARLAMVVGCEGEPGLAVGERLVWEGDRLTHASITWPPLIAAIEGLQASARPRGRVERIPFERGHADVYLEAVAPPPELWICGAGLDAPAMARLAVSQGYRVTVLDHRPAYARSERFPPEAEVRVARPGPALASEPPAAVIVMTHHFEADRGWLGALLALEPRYLGILGPRKRTERLLAELREAGVAVPSGWPACLHAPLGLDLGAEAPEEIALSALAEVRAVLAGRPGGFLKDREAPIHGAPLPTPGLESSSRIPVEPALLGRPSRPHPSPACALPADAATW